MRAQRGNILFLILLAVILFAALSYAVTSSMRGGGKDASSEKVKTLSSEIVQKATLMENTIQRMMLTNGCKDSEISFENPTVANYVNPSANAAGMNKKCHVFDPAGGGLSFPTLPRDAFDPALESVTASWGLPVFTGLIFIKQAGLDCTTEACNELMFVVQGLTKSVCESLNSDLGLPAPLYSAFFAGFEPTVAQDDYFKGTYQYHVSGNNGIDVSHTGFTGRRTGCVQRNLPVYGNPYTFYHVLIAR